MAEETQGTKPRPKAAPKKEIKKKSPIGKIIFTILILLFMIAGVLFALARFQVVTIPFISDLPFIRQDNTGTSSTPELTELQKALQETDKLNKAVQDKQSENEALAKDIDNLKRENQALTKKQTDYEKTIADLQAEIISLKGGQSSQKAAYKQLAVYFTEMKASDAATIIQELDDNDVIGILTEMEDDVAAGILGKFTTERAATISKKMLATSP